MGPNLILASILITFLLFAAFSFTGSNDAFADRRGHWASNQHNNTISDLLNHATSVSHKHHR